MFYFNTVTRATYYEHDIEGDGIDHCYDCRAEIFILENYLLKIGKLHEQNIGSQEARDMISKLSLDISYNCSKQGRLLSMPQPKPFKAMKEFRYISSIYETGEIDVNHGIIYSKIGNTMSNQAPHHQRGSSNKIQKL